MCPSRELLFVQTRHLCGCTFLLSSSRVRCLALCGLLLPPSFHLARTLFRPGSTPECLTGQLWTAWKSRKQWPMRRNQPGCRAHPPGQACECHFAPLSTLNKLELFCAGPGARQLGAQGAVQRGAVYSYLLTLGSARAWQKNINDCKPQQSRVISQGPPPPPLDSNSPLFSTPQRVSRRPFVSGPWSQPGGHAVVARRPHPSHSMLLI